MCSRLRLIKGGRQNRSRWQARRGRAVGCRRPQVVEDGSWARPGLDGGASSTRLAWWGWRQRTPWRRRGGPRDRRWTVSWGAVLVQPNQVWKTTKGRRHVIRSIQIQWLMCVVREELKNQVPIN